jgi:hypothetical protein
MNAAVHNDVLLGYRVRLSRAPLSAIDILLAAGLLLCLVSRASQFRSVSRHPLFPTILTLFGAAVLGGLIAARSSGAAGIDVLRTMHHLMLLPVSILVSYRLTASLRDCRWLLGAHLAAGVATAIMILTSFIQKGLAATELTSLTLLREIGYVSNYAGLAATLLVFTLVAGVRWLPAWLSLPLSILCLAGQVATLSRSDWIAAVAGFAGLLLILLRCRRPATVVKFMVAAVGIAAALVALLTFAARSLGHDLNHSVVERLATMLPRSVKHSQGTKAWDRRLPAAKEELRLWRSSPIVGRGFGIHDVVAPQLGRKSIGLRHNTWTSTLAETGLIGFSAMLLVFMGTGIISWRMARDATDPTTLLVAAFGFITVAHIAVHGLATMSFNAPRGAILPGIVCGLVLRCRSLQLQARKSADTIGGPAAIP